MYIIEAFDAGYKLKYAEESGSWVWVFFLVFEYIYLVPMRNNPEMMVSYRVRPDDP